ncbi:MAG: hypothetical protein ACRDRL_03360 [Sciscionella sp.]
MSDGVQPAEQAGSKESAVGLRAVAALSRRAVHKKRGTPQRTLGRSWTFERFSQDAGACSGRLHRAGML